jgi:hypoxanthine phosphoribosyltransferase
LSAAGLAPLLGTDDILATVRRLGDEIAADHPDGVVLVGVLKGALLFLADLARAIQVPVEVDFISISRFAPDSGRVRILHDVQIDVAGRDVVLVDSLVDTGLTLAYLARTLRDRDPRSLRVCVLLDRHERRIVPHPIDYAGHAVGDDYLIGYGFHFGDRFQNLPALYAVDRDDLVAHPQRYVALVHGGAITPPG